MATRKFHTNPEQSWVSATVTKNIGVFTYRIICYNLPTVFISTSTYNTKATVSSIVQNGTSGGVPVWDIKVSVAFVVGTAEATFLSHLTFYCFSEIHSSDATEGYGIRCYDASGNITYSSDKKPLRIKDYVTITASSNPSNISDLIYSRTFCPNPEQSVFSLAKPAFMNVDFGRYTWWQYVTNDWNYYTWVGYAAYTHCRLWFRNEILTAGVSVNASNTDLDFSLQVYDGKFEIETYSIDTSTTPAPPGTNYIASKTENFSITIPILNGADYD